MTKKNLMLRYKCEAVREDKARLNLEPNTKWFFLKSRRPLALPEKRDMAKFNWTNRKKKPGTKIPLAQEETRYHPVPPASTLHRAPDSPTRNNSISPLTTQ